MNLTVFKASGQQNIVITDVRFPNEAEAIQRWGGKLWLVERPGLVEQEHISENSLCNFAGWDAVLKNDRTIQHLESQIETVIGPK